MCAQEGAPKQPTIERSREATNKSRCHSTINVDKGVHQNSLNASDAETYEKEQQGIFSSVCLENSISQSTNKVARNKNQ